MNIMNIDTKSLDRSNKMVDVAAVLKSRGVTRAPSSHSISLSLVIIILLGAVCIRANKIYLKESYIYVVVNNTQSVRLIQIGQFRPTITITAHPQYPEIIVFIPDKIIIPGAGAPADVRIITHYLWAFGVHPGHSEVTFGASPFNYIDMKTVFLKVTVINSDVIRMISIFVGWMYFAAWSFSFYPQIYSNYKRKSVVGLNPDYLTLNLSGYIMYSVFNCGLYYNQVVQMEYFKRYPRSHNPVHLNDVFFSLHASFATLLTLTQSFRFAHANQTLSFTALFLLCLMAFLLLLSMAHAIAGAITWLGFLYHCSYVQLVTTVLKFAPQAVMNFKRKSTVGFSIGNILLDFAGGILSILQMVLNAWNYNDWASLYGDFTKFSLGLFTLFFDLFFMLQHFVLYRKAREQQPQPDTQTAPS